MTSLVTLAGAPCTRATAQIPAWGCWWADFDLVGEVTLSGRVSCAFAGATLSGTIVSGGPSRGRSAYRVVGGAGGWGQTLPAKPYHDDAGVKLRTVLGDAASAAGETLTGVDQQLRLGPHFARGAALASHLLHALAPRNWYVDLDGTTRIGQRAASAYSGSGTRTRIDPAGLVVEIATEDVSALVPGVTVDGSQPATDVEWSLDEKRLTARVYSGPRPSRRLDAFRRIFDALDPWRKYRALAEYRIVSQDAERLNLQIVRVGTGLPDLPRVPVRPGVAGARTDPKLGGLVLVAFADGDPSRPNVVAFDAPDAPGWLPTLIELGESSDFVSLAGKVGDEIQRIRTWADAHTHPTGVGPSGPPAAPTQAHQSTACTRVKVQ